MYSLTPQITLLSFLSPSPLSYLGSWPCLTSVGPSLIRTALACKPPTPPCKELISQVCPSCEL